MTAFAERGLALGAMTLVVSSCVFGAQVLVSTRQDVPLQPDEIAVRATPYTPLVAFSTDASLVFVPVVVRNHDGVEVGDLAASDFRLLVDGAPAKIAAFSSEHVDGQARSAPAPLAVAWVLDDRVRAKGIVEASWLSSGQAAVLSALPSALPQGTAWEILTRSGTPDLALTSDVGHLRSAIATIHPEPLDDFGNPRAQGYLDEVYRANAADEAATLRQAMRDVSRFRGGRRVVFVGYTLWTNSPRGRSPTLIRGLAEEAQRDQIAIDVVDTRGVGSVLGDGDLAGLAEETGGVYYHNNNDLARGARQLSTPDEWSYVLAFAPGAKADGEMHRLRVSLDGRRGDRVQARSAFAMQPADRSPMPMALQRAFIASIAASANSNGIGIRFDDIAEGPSLRVQFGPASWKKLAAVGMQLRGSLGLTVPAGAYRLRLMAGDAYSHHFFSQTA